MKNLLAPVLFLIALPAIAQPPSVEDLGEFRIDTELSTYIFPFGIAVSHDRVDSSFVVVWASYHSLGGFAADILARRFDSLGQALDVESLVNQETFDVQQWPSASHAPDGGFVVAWQDFAGGPISSLGIDAQRLDALGVQLGAQLAVDVIANDQDRPAVSHAPDSSFLIAWQEGGDADGSGRGIRARRFDESGGAVGGEFQVNDYTAGNQTNPRVSHAPDGSAVVVWHGAAQGVSSAVQARRFDAMGAPVGADLRVSTSSYGFAGIADVSHDPGGGFVVVWTADDGPPGSNGIQARLYDSLGEPAGEPFQVDTAPDDPTLPKVSHAPDGSFVIAWQITDDLDFTDRDVRARLFDSLGLAVGDEFQVNDDDEGRQTVPDVSFGTDGQFVVVWADQQGFSPATIRANLYRANLGPPPNVLEIPALGTLGVAALAILLALIGIRRIGRFG